MPIRSVKYDPVDDLQNSKRWEEEIRRLKEELESITEVSAIDTSKVSVQTSNIADINADIAIRREDILGRIEDIQGNIDEMKTMRSKLTKEENEVIDIFFFGQGNVGAKVDCYAQEHYISIMKVYRIRREALQHMREIFTELHCGEWVQIK